MHSLVPAACHGLFQPQLGFTGTGKMCAECQPFQGFQNTVWKLGGSTLERRSSKQVAACIYLNFIPAQLLYLPDFFSLHSCCAVPTQAFRCKRDLCHGVSLLLLIVFFCGVGSLASMLGYSCAAQWCIG